jgi:hypothetical protein
MAYVIKKIGRKGKPKRYYIYDQESKRVDGKVKTKSRYIGPLRRLFATAVSYGMLAKHELSNDRDLDKLVSNWRVQALTLPEILEKSETRAAERAAIMRERDPAYQEQLKHAHFEQLKAEEIRNAREKSADQDQRDAREEVPVSNTGAPPGEQDNNDFSVSGPTD